MAGLGQHQVDRGIAAVDEVLSGLGEVSLLGLDAEATGVSLVALARLEARVAELRSRVLAHGAEVAVERTCGATTTATWFAHATRTTVRASRRAVFFAEALGRYEVLRVGMAAGGVHLEQGEVIARALDALPAEVASWVRVEAEQALVALAARHDAQQLRVLGERILHVVAPEVGEAHEAKQLADAEAAAEKATRLSLTPDGTGKVHGRFTIPELHAGMLRKFLMSLVVSHQDPGSATDVGRGVGSASDEPRDPTATGAVDEPTDPLQHELQPQRRATGHELGQAFCDLLSEYGVDFWVRWLRQRTETLRGEGPSGAGAFASGWGGMGGFLDLIIHHVNGHPIAEADIDSVNGRLDQLQGEMYRKAERIRTHT